MPRRNSFMRKFSFGACWLLSALTIGAMTKGVSTSLAEATALAKRLDEQLKSLISSRMEAEKKAVVADEKLRQTRETCERTRKQLDSLLGEAAALKADQIRAEERQAS